VVAMDLPPEVSAVASKENFLTAFDYEDSCINYLHVFNVLCTFFHSEKIAEQLVTFIIILYCLPKLKVKCYTLYTPRRGDATSTRRFAQPSTDIFFNNP
jgi:hypothetical protein